MPSCGAPNLRRMNGAPGLLPSLALRLSLLAALLLAAPSCRGPLRRPVEEAAARVELVGPIWTCTELGTTEVPREAAPTLLFGKDGRASGSTGINRFFGGFKREGTSGLRFEKLSLTRRAGTEEQTRTEQDFIAGLEACSGFQISGMGIDLLAGDEVVMRLSAVTDREDWIPAPPPLEGPPGSMDGGVEWIKLTSGEWLKGEFTALTRDSVEFDSDELDNLKLDWADVAELYTTRPYTLLLESRDTRVGALRVVGDTIVVMAGGQQEVLRRDEVQRMVAGQPGESNYWSGDVDISVTAREGNTEQLDVASRLSALRRTAHSRLDLYFEAIYGTQNTQRVTNNQRFTGKFDRYISSRLFWTILGTEIYSDEFQNLDRRTSPYTGLGYTLFDRSGLEWNVSLGGGYRETRYDSVAPGQDDRDLDAFLQLSADLDYDITEKVELIMSYSAQVGLENIDNTNQNGMAELDFDLMDDFDIFIRFTLSRIGQPIANDDGSIPKKNDYRYDFGWRWSW